MQSVTSAVMETIRYGSAQGRWVIAAAVLGSGIAFLDGSVVNSALPKIREDLGATLAGQQWVVTGYLLTLGSLLVVGGSLGDRFGRRRLFVLGLVGFSVTSLLCGLAPNLGWLVFGRIVQGVSAAALVPGSLAMLSSVFHPDDRARAIGAWSGLASVSTALGPFLGGWLIDSVSWRWIFLINPLIAVVPITLALRWIPETRNETADRVDVTGGVLLSVALAGIVYALIEGPSSSWPAVAIVAGIVGVLAMVTFATFEGRTSSPMVPLSLFRSRQFSGANATTFVVWGAIGAVFFLLTLHLQNDLGYSALEAGAASLPITIMMALFAARGGALAQRIGPRIPMTVGPLIIGSGFALMTMIKPGHQYVATVLPAVLVFGVGLVLTVAPLTATVLAAVDDRFAGVGSAVNNAVSRIASLLVIAVIPSLAGIAGGASSLGQGFSRAMWLCASLCVVGALISVMTITNGHDAERGRS